MLDVESAVPLWVVRALHRGNDSVDVVGVNVRQNFWQRGKFIRVPAVELPELEGPKMTSALWSCSKMPMLPTRIA